MGFLIFLFFAIVVGGPAVMLVLRKQEQIAKRDERMGIYNGPVQRYFSEPESGPFAYGEGDTVQPADGTTDYSTVLHVRNNVLQGKGLSQVTVRNNRTGEIKTAVRTTWKKAELTW